MQRKLTEEQIENLRLARNGISAGIPWFSIGQAEDFWNQAVECLGNKIKHGTSDGKPYVEPDPPIPEGWRKANADEYKRRDVKCWNYSAGQWEMRLVQGFRFGPPEGRSVYIVPIDPPLTDEDACVWPRLLVMVRDGNHEQWEGPFQYVGKDTSNDCSLKYLVWGTNGYHEWYEQARRATTEEIEAAHGNS